MFETSKSSLSPAELRRYDRHILLPEVGRDGQERLKQSSVLVVGAGGLGSPLALYLAAAGVGRIGIVDFDEVDESNLQRQIIHGTSDVGRPKLESARDSLREVNPHVQLDLIPTALRSENALDVCRPYDVIIDGTDNFPTRYLVNDVCVLLGKPNVYGSIFRFEGQVSVFWAEKGPCYRCLYPEPPPPGQVPSCAEGGVFGVLPGVVGTLQATECIKLLLGIGDLSIGRLLLYDALTLSFRTLNLHKDPKCRICGEDPEIKSPIDYYGFCGIPQPTSSETFSDLGPKECQERIEAGAFLLDIREPQEYEFARLEGATLIPLGDLPGRMEELPRDREIIVYCRSGQRSLTACALLAAAGFPQLVNMEGGILRWGAELDPSIPWY